MPGSSASAAVRERRRGTRRGLREERGRRTGGTAGAAACEEERGEGAEPRRYRKNQSKPGKRSRAKEARRTKQVRVAARHPH